MSLVERRRHHLRRERRSIRRHVEGGNAVLADWLARLTLRLPLSISSKASHVKRAPERSLASYGELC